MKKIILLPLIFFPLTLTLFSCSPKDQILSNGKTDGGARVTGKGDTAAKPELYANMAYLLQRDLESVKVIRWALNPKLAESSGVTVTEIQKDAAKAQYSFSFKNLEKTIGTSSHTQKNFAVTASVFFDEAGKVKQITIATPIVSKAEKFENKIITQVDGKPVDILMRNKLKSVVVTPSKFPIEGAKVYSVLVNSVDEVNSAAVGKAVADHESNFDIKTINGLEDLLTEKELAVPYIKNDLVRAGKETFNLTFNFKGDGIKLLLGDCVNFSMNVAFNRADASAKSAPKPVTIKSDEANITFAEKIVMPLPKCEERVVQEDMSLLFN